MDFLDKIDDIRADVERQKFLEEQKELEDFDKMQQVMREEELKQKLELEKKVPRKSNSIGGSASNSKSQMKLLAGAVKRKAEKEEQDTKKTKTAGASSLLGLSAYGSDSSDSEQ